MKKLSLLLLLSVFVFCSCGDDDDDVKNEVVVSFENLLTEENSQFIADGTPNNQAFMGHRTKRFFQWSGKMGERL